MLCPLFFQMLKLLLFCALPVSLSRTSETRGRVKCKILLSGMFCIPGSESVPEALKSLKHFNMLGFPRFSMQTENREMKTQVGGEKNKNTRDSRNRILKRTSMIKDRRIRTLKRANRIKDSRIRIL